MEEVHTVHSLIPDGDVLKDQPVDQPLLHPPQQLWLVLQQSNPPWGRYADVLGRTQYRELGRAL